MLFVRAIISHVRSNVKRYIAFCRDTNLRTRRRKAERNARSRLRSEYARKSRTRRMQMRVAHSPRKSFRCECATRVFAKRSGLLNVCHDNFVEYYYYDLRQRGGHILHTRLREERETRASTFRLCFISGHADIIIGLMSDRKRLNFSEKEKQ